MVLGNDQWNHKIQAEIGMEKKRGHKLLISEIKKGTSQQTLQTYKGTLYYKQYVCPQIS